MKSTSDKKSEATDNYVIAWKFICSIYQWKCLSRSLVVRVEELVTLIPQPVYFKRSLVHGMCTAKIITVVIYK